MISLKCNSNMSYMTILSTIYLSLYSYLSYPATESFLCERLNSQFNSNEIINKVNLAYYTSVTCPPGKDLIVL